MRPDSLQMPIGSSHRGPRDCLVAVSHCGRVHGWTRAEGQLALEWALAMREAGWQVGTRTHSEILNSEPTCTTCQLQRACLEARRCHASGNLAQIHT